MIHQLKKYVYIEHKHPLFVTEGKFMCPMHSEARQTTMSELGAEKGLLQVRGRGVPGFVISSCTIL